MKLKGSSLPIYKVEQFRIVVLLLPLFIVCRRYYSVWWCRRSPGPSFIIPSEPVGGFSLYPPLYHIVRVLPSCPANSTAGLWTVPFRRFTDLSMSKKRKKRREREKREKREKREERRKREREREEKEEREEGAELIEERKQEEGPI